MKGRKLAAAAAVAGLMAGLWPGSAVAGQSGDVVMTDNGGIRGTVSTQYREFQGIPFAAAPVGLLRWASPQPAPQWSGVRDATKPGSRCAQKAGLLGEDVSYNEDCLYLNVTTPRRAHKLPVMVWVHGGGYRNGAGSVYRPVDMVVRGDVVVVTVNYRLGVFGFLSHPSLPRSGNFGLEDQQAALRWVQRNAEAFGGDPRNVTLFGESAGGVSTCAQLVSPVSAGLFHRAVIQSGPCTMGIWPDVDGTPDPTGIWLPRSRAAADQQGLTVATTLGCPYPATAAVCLRAKPTTELLPQSDYGFGPVVGGDLLPVFPAQAVAEGRFTKVPVMHGITRDEYRTFTAGLELTGLPPVTPGDYPNLAAAFAGADRATAVLDRYPLRNYGSPSEAWSAVITDAIFAKSTSYMSRQLSRYVPTYTYEFADRSAPWLKDVPKPSFPTGAYHAAELQYQFDALGGNALSEAQKQLSRTMIDYWTRFAHTGNPNGPGTPNWQRSTGSHAQSLDTGPGGVRPVDFGREHQYPFWR